LKAKPYHLSDEDIAWVENTIVGMTTEEKTGQLFVNLFWDLDPAKTQELLDKYHIGAAIYNPYADLSLEVKG
jgi:beta-N-acetylhexosaminidase